MPLLVEKAVTCNPRWRTRVITFIRPTTMVVTHRQRARLTAKTPCCLSAMLRIPERFRGFPASFRDRVINIMDASRQGINAICMALLMVADTGDGRAYEKNIETAVAVIEFLLLWGELLQESGPTYSFVFRVPLG